MNKYVFFFLKKPSGLKHAFDMRLGTSLYEAFSAQSESRASPLCIRVSSRKSTLPLLPRLRADREKSERLRLNRMVGDFIGFSLP